MPSDSSPAVSIIWWLIPLVITALLNAAASAIIYADDAIIKNDAAAGGKKSARILKLIENNRHVGVALYIANFMLFLFSAPYFNQLIRLSFQTLSPELVSIIGVLVYAFIFSAFGVSIPTRISAYYPQSIAYGLLTPLSLLNAILTPVVKIIDIVGSVIITITGNDPKTPPTNVTEEEIRMLVDEGEESGAIEELEKDMINNILKFDDRTVDEVMTHRTQVVSAEIDTPLGELVEIAMNSGNSRIPVYEEDIDSILGIIYAKDLLKFLSQPESFDAKATMRKPLFVHASTTCAQMMTLFKEKKTQLAIVTDEYGGTYGIVTMEDLLEAIVGNIQDEYDDELEIATELSEGVFNIGGSMSINDVEDLLDVQFPEDTESDTIGGFVTERLGGVPTSLDIERTVEFRGVAFTVIEVNEKRILKLRATLLNREEKE